MSQLRVYRPDSANDCFGDDGPRVLSFAFYAPLIRAERAMQVLRKARMQREAVQKFRNHTPKPIQLRIFSGPFRR